MSLKSILNPGTEVVLSDGTTKCHVYPISFKQIGKFATRIIGAISSIASALPSGKRMPTNDEVMAVLSSRAIPVVLSDLMDLVAECTRFDDKRTIDDLPHWDVPLIIEAWIEENFSDPKKWTTWVTTIELLMEKVTKKPFSFKALMSETASKPSSPADTPSTTSSIDDSQDSLTTAGA